MDQEDTENFQCVQDTQRETHKSVKSVIMSLAIIVGLDIEELENRAKETLMLITNLVKSAIVDMIMTAGLGIVRMEVNAPDRQMLTRNLVILVGMEERIISVGQALGRRVNHAPVETNKTLKSAQYVKVDRIMIVAKDLSEQVRVASEVEMILKDVRSVKPVVLDFSNRGNYA